MHLALKIHPNSLCRAVERIEVDVARPRPDALTLNYLVSGAIAGLRLPPVAASTRTDELWRHTCFEAFVRASAGEDYYEFNFAPSTQWAAYRFRGYRAGMSAVHEIAAPRIDVRADDTHLEMQVSLSSLQLAGVWRLGLSTVIEETSGDKSYWALAHPPGKADFHHADGFALELPIAEQT